MRVCLYLRLLSPLVAACSDTNRTQIVSAGGSTVVVASMRQFPEDSGVQSFGAGALANLAHNDRKLGRGVVFVMRYDNTVREKDWRSRKRGTQAT